MLTLYRRHLGACPHLTTKKKRGTPAQEKDSCDCPIWVQGTIGHESKRLSLDTTAWSRALKEKRQLEDGIIPQEQPKSSTIKGALAAFIEECETIRHLSRNTLRKYRTLEKHVGAFALHRKQDRIDHFTGDLVRDFIGTRNLSARTSQKEIQHLRTFFNYCIEREWLVKNPAKFRTGKVAENPRIPFSEKEIQAILSKAQDDRELGFLLVLRHTGLRIGDASLLRQNQFSDGRIHLYPTKAGTPVSIIIPETLTSLLKKLPAQGGYFFLRGESTHPHTASDLWRKRIKAICKTLDIRPAHPHRFRHSLAADLLSRGVSVENVAAILGNSPAIVIKHYSQFVKTRQDALDAAIEKTWKPSLARVK